MSSETGNGEPDPEPNWAQEIPKEHDEDSSIIQWQDHVCRLKSILLFIHHYHHPSLFLLKDQKLQPESSIKGLIKLVRFVFPVTQSFVNCQSQIVAGARRRKGRGKRGS